MIKELFGFKDREKEKLRKENRELKEKLHRANTLLLEGSEDIKQGLGEMIEILEENTAEHNGVVYLNDDQKTDMAKQAITIYETLKAFQTVDNFNNNKGDTK